MTVVTNLQKLMTAAAYTALQECAVRLHAAADDIVELEKVGPPISASVALRAFADAIVLANATEWAKDATQH